MSESFRYEAYGLVIAVPFECPALLPARDGRSADVAITEGPVPPRLDDAVVSDSGIDLAPGRVLVRGGARAGRFLVEAGRVVLRRNPDWDPDVLARQVTDRVMAAVLHCQGLLVLHANAAVVDGVGVVLAGESGAGKSTTLAALVAAGHRMLSDDVTALRMVERSRFEVIPGAAQLHLTSNAAAALAIDITGVTLQPWRRMKAAVPTRPGMSTEPAPLGPLFWLRAAAVPEVSIRSLSGAERFSVIQRSLYLPEFEADTRRLFPLLDEAAAGPVLELTRPADRWSVDAVVGAIVERASRDCGQTR